MDKTELLRKADVCRGVLGDCLKSSLERGDFDSAKHFSTEIQGAEFMLYNLGLISEKECRKRSDDANRQYADARWPKEGEAG